MVTHGCLNAGQKHNIVKGFWVCHDLKLTQNQTHKESRVLLALPACATRRDFTAALAPNTHAPCTVNSPHVTEHQQKLWENLSSLWTKSHQWFNYRKTKDFCPTIGSQCVSN